MRLRIGGMGWVTPLGSGVQNVWQRLLAGDQPAAETIVSPLRARSYPAYRIPTDAIASAPAHPRLRRASAISKFAAAAGLAALEDAQVKLDPESAARTAIIFAISNGGVVYTKRFYHEVVETGAQAASPLLFPETVFNAPASHLAAILGITGASYTLVGDGAVGLLALKMAEDLMQSDMLNRCLIVGAEEADWLLCDAYHRWRLLRGSTPLSEGAGALLVDRAGPFEIERIDAGYNFSRRRDAASCLDQVFGRLHATDDDIVIVSANGTFIDQAEDFAIQRHCPAAPVYAPKFSLGEGVGAASIWQVICAASALQTGQLPRTPNISTTRRALVSCCGLNQQIAGLTLRVANGATSPSG